MFGIVSNAAARGLAANARVIRPLCVSRALFASAPTKAKAQASKDGMIPYIPVPEHIKKMQAKFQVDNDVPVFLKGGPMDQILYRFTLLLCVGGFVQVVYFVLTKSGIVKIE